MDNIPTLLLPSIPQMLGESVDPSAVTDEQDIEYNRLCNEKILETLGMIRDSGVNPPKVIAMYPNDTEGTADVLSLDREGNIVVLVDGGEQ